ncbi:MAG: CDP-diacylglycerol--serine O-phosphatidyltransferase [Candidatus Omnitrophica bacterium]|nr:CDP-diacylglycerol--serine O-phosphatidyltransferase [Candidatus Omnitrophota bacterium]
MKDFFTLTNLITVGNLFCGSQAIFFAISGKVEQAAYLIFYAMIFDFLDGKVARMTNTVSELGAQLDSLADMVSFGVAPAVIFYAVYNDVFGIFCWIFPFIFISCGMFRLARYNVCSKHRSVDCFYGLAIPAAAGLIVSALVLYSFEIEGLLVFFIPLLMLITALLMISEIPYTNFRKVGLRKRLFIILAALVFVFTVIVNHFYAVIFWCFVLYALSGIIFLLSSYLCGNKFLSKKGGKMKTLYLLITLVFVSGCFVIVDQDRKIRSFGLATDEAQDMVNQINQKTDADKTQRYPLGEKQ